MNKKATYQKLNDESIKCIIANIGEDDKGDLEFKRRIQEEGDVGTNIMKVPMMKRQTEKFHKKYEASRRKQSQEQMKSRQQIYGEKGKGQWRICRDMSQQSTTPLSAVRRTKTTKHGLKGTIATSPGRLMKSSEKN